MFIAIAIERSQIPFKKDDYKIWYLETNHFGNVVSIGVKKPNEVLNNLIQYHQRTGKSNWRFFEKNSQTSRPIEILDFISLNDDQNTHFGNLPTLAEFQETLRSLEMNLQLRSVA